MREILLYALVLIAYAPGVAVLVLSRRVWRFPIICFAFFGMFLFNAVGSLAVFSESKLYWLNFDASEVALELSLVLAAQALAFYAVCGPYVMLRKGNNVQFAATASDISLVAISAGAIIVIAAMYYRQTGGFLIQAALDGSMDVGSAMKYRDQFVYGLPNWPVYNLAFVFIPIILSNHGLLTFLSSPRRSILFPLACLLVSFGASLSLGSKGGLITFLLTLSVAYVCFLGMTGRAPHAILRSKAYLAFAGLSLATLVLGYIMSAADTLTVVALIQRILYRVLVAYPETLAAAISFFHNEGPLGISVLPNMRGLLQHEQVNLSAVLHQYQANTAGGVSVPFAGEAYLVSGWSSLLLALPIVFLTLIALQELAMRLRVGLFGLALASLYSYQAIQLSLNGTFSSLYNFMYPGTVLALGICAALTGALVEHLRLAIERRARDELL